VVRLTLIGGLLVLGAAYLIGADSGVAGFLLSWAIVGAGVMVGGVVGIFWSLPRFAKRTNALAGDRGVESDRLDDAGVERVLKRYMSRYSYGCALCGYLVGVITAMAIV